MKTDNKSDKPCLSVAVASGPYVFIYRNLRPFFKFTIPAVELDKKELAIWGKVHKAQASISLSAIRPLLF